MRHQGLLLLTALLWLSSATPAAAGTITVTFSLTSGAGSWNTNQSNGMPISLSAGSAVVEIAGAGLVTPTGSVATLVNFFATGVGPNLNQHSLQLFGLQAQVVGTPTPTLTATAGATTVLGSVGGPSGVFPLMSGAAVLFQVTNFASSGNAGFRFVGGTFGGATVAQLTQTVQGVEVSRSFVVPEPAAAQLVAFGLLGLGLVSGVSLRAARTGIARPRS